MVNPLMIVIRIHFMISLHNGDSREHVKSIDDKSIDFIFTDPPYNIANNIKSSNLKFDWRADVNNDIATWDYEDLNIEFWCNEFRRVLKDTGNLFIFCSYAQIGDYYRCLDPYYNFGIFVWHKTNPTPQFYKNSFLNSVELLITCWNKKHTWNFTKQNEMHNYYESPICMGNERLKNPKHPTQKPLKLLEHLIPIASNEQDIIYDPFMGVGSVGVAAKKLNRGFIGSEIDTDYFNAAKMRIDLVP